ncbi:MAG: MerR family transcriptional regulator [Lachnospiraceae bacterium]|nr:MerR family transcriptional regulator [Lachnospiraceae bacterium]
MKTVHEVSRLTGVSIRALQYYDRIGLLKATAYTEAGYRLYDEEALERLQQILLFRELQFPLQEIKNIIGQPDFDRDKALEQQIELLKLQKEHVEGLIALAEKIRGSGGHVMEFDAFDKKKIEEYQARAKEAWGHTEEYRDYEERQKSRTEKQNRDAAAGLMDVFREFGEIRGGDPAGEEAQALAAKLQAYISANYYNCSKEVLSGLGKMYAAGGEFTKNIDAAGGEGTAVFASEAIQIFCGRQ